MQLLCIETKVKGLHSLKSEIFHRIILQLTESIRETKKVNNCSGLSFIGYGMCWRAILSVDR